MKRDNIDVNDRQLACAHINSEEGQDYLKGMAAAANYAWVNRASMTFLCRQVGIAAACRGLISYGFLFVSHFTCMLVFSQGISPTYASTYLCHFQEGIRIKN